MRSAGASELGVEEAAAEVEAEAEAAWRASKASRPPVNQTTPPARSTPPRAQKGIMARAAMFREAPTATSLSSASASRVDGVLMASDDGVMTTTVSLGEHEAKKSL